jgi:hypothetical protein
MLQTLRAPRTELVIEDEPASPILAPCRGHVFDFQVFACFTWSTPDLNEDTMSGWVWRFGPQARLRLQRLAAEVACRFGPKECQQFGEELNRRLAGTQWRFVRQHAVLTCDVWCHVALDSELRSALQPIWRARIEMEERHELNQRRAELARGITEAWSSIIEKLQDDPFSEAAAALGDKEFAAAFVRWCEERRKETDGLIALLVPGPGRSRVGVVGRYEYSESLDAALKAFKREHGLSDEDE